MKRPVRISSEEMARLAFENPGREIELDEDHAQAYLTIGPCDFVATYDEAPS